MTLSAAEFWKLHQSLQSLGVNADMASQQLYAMHLAGLSAQQIMDRLGYWSQFEEEDPFRKSMRDAIARAESDNNGG